MSVITTLHDTSMLVYVSVRLWSARKLDRKATKKLTDEAGASAEAARVNKYLLANADEQLRDLQRIARRARDTLVNRSLPWNDAGMRLVSNADSIALMGELYAVEQDFAKAVDAFITEYPRLRELALQSLGDMAAEEDYPPVDVVRSKFSIRTSFEPLPAGFSDARVGLSPDQQEALQKVYQAQAAERFQDAVQAAWERLRDNVQRYVERLEPEPDGSQKRFQATMVTSLRDTMSLLSNLNVFDTPELQRLKFQIEEALCKHDPEILRNNASASSSAYEAARAIVSRIASMATPAN